MLKCTSKYFCLFQSYYFECRTFEKLTETLAWSWNKFHYHSNIHTKYINIHFIDYFIISKYLLFCYCFECCSFQLFIMIFWVTVELGLQAIFFYSKRLSNRGNVYPIDSSENLTHLRYISWALLVVSSNRYCY